MTKVITYGTYDLFHEGHRRLLQRAKALGDYLIVGVTSDSFDQQRGKINVSQSVMERIEAVKETGLADEIIVEEYEGQKIDDICRMGVSIFAIGSDWEGRFDYLKEYCQVVYLPRTEGVSSSELRAEQMELRIGMIGDDTYYLDKFERESHYVNGVRVERLEVRDERLETDGVDALFLYIKPEEHFRIISEALRRGKHVLCDPPLAICMEEFNTLQQLARENGCVFMEAIRSAYSTAYHRLVALAKSGVIGEVVSIDSTCTSLRDAEQDRQDYNSAWNSITFWGPNALLPVFDILGTEYVDHKIFTRREPGTMYDHFTKMDFTYNGAVASVKVGKGMKSEGELIISGTTGYIYVPAPWWKTDYFEVRREDPTQNKRYYYQLDGEGIRYEILSFLKAVQRRRETRDERRETRDERREMVDIEVSRAIVKIMEEYYHNEVVELGVK